MISQSKRMLLLLVLVLGSIFTTQGWAQVVYNTVDNFDRTDNNSLGAPWTENEADATQFAITSNTLSAVTAGVSGLEPTNATLDLTAQNANFDLGQSKIGWSVHIDLNRDPSGWGSTNYSLGWVLTANETDLSSATVDGYAVIWTATNNELVLVRFENGISGLDPGTTVVSTGLDWSTLGTDGLNVRVEVTPEGVWTLFYEAGAALATATDINAASATGTDNTLFGDAAQIHSGPIWAHNTAVGVNDSGSFDNFSFGIETSNIALASSVAVGADNVLQGTSNHIIYAFDLAATSADATLTQVNFTSAGTYAASDINAFTLWFSNDNAFDATTDQAIGSLTSSLGAGAQSFTSLSQVITSGTTGYFFITTNVDALATTSNTIEVSTAITTADLTFSGVVNQSGTANVGGIQTITACTTPSDVSTLTGIPLSTQVILNWINGSCYDEILVVAKDGSTITNTPTGDGTAYTANAAFGSGTELAVSSGEFVVFKGTTTTETITSLTDNTIYFFKVFGRKGTTWSSGIEISVTPRAALLAWEFNGNAGNEVTVNSTTQAANVSTTAPSNVIARGAGILAAANGNRFNADNWDAATIADAIANNEYFEWTIEATDGFSMSLNSLVFNIQRSGTGPNSFALRSSLDNYATNLTTFSVTTTSTSVQNIALTGHENLVQPITFRLYGAGATGTAGSAGFEGTGNDLAINGNVTAVGATIATSTNALSNFSASTEAAANPSASQSFLVTAENLSADVSIVLNPTTDFEISTDNTNFFATLTALPRNGTDLNGEPVPIYVRLKQGLTAGFKTATITLSSTGATDQVINLSGNAVGHNGLAFDGANDFVDVTGYAGIGGTDARTVEAWIKTSDNVNAQVITRWGASNGEEWSVQVNGGKLYLTANGKSKTGTADIADGNWHHVAVTFTNDGTPNITDAIFYVDGTIDAQSAAISGSFNTNIIANTVLIGKNIDDTRFFNGTIDELRIWSVARSQLEIQQKFRCELAGTETGLEAYYNFNQGTAEGNNAAITTVTDGTANARNGALTNFDLSLSNTTSNFVAGSPSVNLNREIDLQGNGVSIVNNDVTPATADFTDFGNVSSNTVLTRTFTIANTGTEALSLLNTGAFVTITGTGSSAFTVTQPSSGTVAGGGNQTFEIKFAPNNEGTFTATVTIQNNDCDEGTYSFSIQGIGTARAPIAIEELQRPVTLEFNNYTGAGVSSSPTIAQLHSLNWSFAGMSEGQVLNGETNTTGDYARGTSTGGVTTGGLYAFDINGNTAFGFQANGTDFDNGKAVLRLQNQTGSTITAAQIAYNLYVFNDQDIASTINLEYSTDGINFTAAPAFTFTSPTTNTGASWSAANAINGYISGLRLANNEYLYIRWDNDLSAASEADEIAIDDIQVTAFAIDTRRTNYVALDGTGDYVEVADNANINFNSQSFTVEMWVKSVSNTGTQTLISKQNGGAGYDLIYNGGTSLVFTVTDGIGSTSTKTFGTSLSTTDWSHIAAVYDNATGNTTIYVNGQTDFAGPGTAGINASNALPLRIGANQSATNAFTGNVDEVRIWNVARTASEIRENMHLTLLGNETGIVSYYQFSEASGTTTAELISNNTGTLQDNANFVASTVNAGRNGASNTQTVGSGAVGNIDFTTGTDANATMNFTAHSTSEDFTVTYQRFNPNATSGLTVSETTYQNPMWTINKSDATSTFTADITFNYPNNTFDNLVPRNYVLYNRTMGADGNWTKLSIVPTSITANTITFPGVTVTGQFLVVREQDKPDAIRGQMLDLDGAGDYVEVADNTSINFNSQSFTVEMWVKSASNAGTQTLISKQNGGAGYDLIYNGGTSLVFTVTDGIGSTSTKTFGTSLSTTDWSHIAAVYNSATGNTTIYVNGQTDFAGPGTAGINASNALPLRIGADQTAANAFNGNVDEVRIWNAARTANEIRENMHLTSIGTETNLVSYWQFNNDANDYINGNNGTLNDNATVSTSSTVNVGRPGASQTINVPTTTTGNQDFTASANLAINITTAQAVATDDITVTYQQFTPNVTTGITGTTLFDNPMWTINKSTTNGTFTGDITFTFPTNVFANRFVLGNYQLYRRNMGADGTWTITGLSATAITNNTITFAGFDNTMVGQLMVVRTSEAAPDNSRGTMLTLDGAGDYVEVADNTSINFNSQSFTVEMWVKSASNAGTQTLISKQNGGAGYDLIYNGGTSLVFTVTDGIGSTSTKTFGTSLSTTDWSHIAAVYNSATGNTTIYVNGQTDFAGPGTAGINASNALPLRIGANQSAANAFTGNVDEVRIWNAARTADEIRENMHLTSQGSETNIVSYWQFNGDSNDDIGSNNGTLQDNANVTNNSTVNVGRPGAAESNSIANGTPTQNFATANAGLVFTAHSATENFSITYQAFNPNATTGITGTTLYQNPMWTINKGDAAATFNANVTFTFPNNTFDQLIAGNYALYRRNVGADGTWALVVSQATSVTTNTIVFNGISEIGQYMVVRTTENGLTANAGNCLTFDGTNQHLSTATLVSNVTDDFTIEGWVRWDGGGPTADKVFFYNGQSESANTTGYGIGLNESNNVTAFIGNNTATVTELSSGQALTVGEWVHVALVRRANSWFIYIDGVEQDLSNTTTPEIPTVATYMGSATGGARGFNGRLDEWRMWTTSARSITEIRENMHLINFGNETNLIANWQFNETSGTEAFDYVGSFTANYNNSPSITTSTAPIGRGASNTTNVSTASQDVTFGTTGMRIVFGAGTVPGGDVVVTRLNSFPNIYPTLTTAGSYWVIHNYGANATFDNLVTVEMTLLNSDQISGDDETTPNNLQIYKRNSGSDGTWGSSLGGASSASNSTKVITFTALTGFTSFSQVLTGSIGTSGLPITLAQFEASRISENVVRLDWETLSEINNAGFEIQKSENGVEFEKIGYVDGAGNSKQSITYQFTDNDAIRSAYYRLKQTDSNGEFSYSPVRFVKGADLVKLTIYPNPTTQSVKLGFGSALETKLPITTEIVTSQGRSIFKTKGDLTKVQEDLNTQLTQMPGGTYLLKVLVGNQYYIQKVVKQ
ncbi:hypothetical protein BKI52_10650 [marine bacterium AO1-C]|nr:hypothetical protein BKI52_10650 [marine bacterium AO1-C]